MGNKHSAASGAAAQKWSEQDCAGGALACNIVGLAGPICTVSLSAKASLLEVQAAIEAKSGVGRWSQRLYHALQEVRSDGDVARLSTEAQAVDLTLVRRPVKQTRWLQELDEANSAYDWMAHAEEDARADRDVALAAVARDGRTLQFVSEELQADREVALAAVARSWLAFEYASPELRADSEVANTAVARDWGAVRYAAREPREDLELDSHIFVSLGLVTLFLCAVVLRRWAAAGVLAASLASVHFVQDPREDMKVEQRYYAGMGLGFALLLCLAAVDDGKFWFWAAQVVAALGAGVWVMLTDREWFLLPPRLSACLCDLARRLHCRPGLGAQPKEACSTSVSFSKAETGSQ